MWIIVKKIFDYIVILAIILLCSACEFKFKPNEEADAVPLTVQRYDRLQSRYLTTGDFSALQQMNTDYPIETRTLIEKMLQLGTITDANITSWSAKDKALQVNHLQGSFVFIHFKIAPYLHP